MVKHAKCTLTSVSGVSDRSVRARDSLQGAPSNLPDDNAPPIGLYASRTLDVETWHRHLGHCNFGAIVDMALFHHHVQLSRISFVVYPVLDPLRSVSPVSFHACHVLPSSAVSCCLDACHFTSIDRRVV